MKEERIKSHVITHERTGNVVSRFTNSRLPFKKIDCAKFVTLHIVEMSIHWHCSSLINCQGMCVVHLDSFDIH